MIFLPTLAFMCFAAYACIGIYVYSINRKSLLNLVCMLLCGSFALLALSYALDLYICSPVVDKLWVIMRNIAYCSFGGLMLHMVVLMTGLLNVRRKLWLYMGIYAPGALLFLLRITIFIDIGIMGSNAYEINRYTMFLYHLVFSVISFVLIWLWSKRTSLSRERKQAKVIIFMSGTSLLLSMGNQILIKVFGKQVIPNINYVFILFTAVGILYAMSKYKFMSPSSLVTPEDILSNVTDLIMLTSPEGKVVWVNSRFRQLLGYEDDRLTNMMLSDILDDGSEDITVSIAGRHFEKAQFPDRCFTVACGEKIPVDIFITNVRDICGDIAGIVVIGSDIRSVKLLQLEIAEHKEAEERLKYLNMYDALTGLYNRTVFEQEIGELSAKPDGAASIIICDLDGLKLANDTLGHKNGDMLLIAAARILNSFSADDRLVARIGGDEFAIVLKNSSPELLKEIVSGINSKVSEYNSSCQQFPLNLSVGYSTSGVEQKSILDMFKEADDNMYREKLSRRYITRDSVTRTLSKMLEARDYITEGHAERLKELAEKLGTEAGLSGQDITDLKLLAQFHDIGKVGIPEYILFKPGKLNEQEEKEMKRHSEVGYRIAQSSPELMHISDWILMHHEWWNGKGYPIGAEGADIPLQSRIIAICDAFDAMINDRPYRKAMSVDDALAELAKCSGTRFDPELVDVFIRIICRKDAFYINT